MINFFKNFYMLKKLILIFSLLIFIFLIGVAYRFDKALAIGLLIDISILAIIFAILLGKKFGGKELYYLLLIGFLIHLASVLFIYFIGFRPVGGGADYEFYHQIAQEISYRFWQGNFSLEGLFIGHGFPLLIGLIYILILPQVIIPGLLSIWLFILSLFFVYLIICELGGSKKLAFLIGIIASIYPSYLYFGSLLLKDTIIIPLALSGSFLAIKMLKKFSWRQFLIFFLILTALIQLRFYIGYALLFSFIISWFLASNFCFKDRAAYGIVLIFLLGFSPQLLDNGYYGSKMFKTFLNPQKITLYREIAYSPSQQADTSIETPVSQAPASATTAPAGTTEGAGSTFVIETGFDKGTPGFFKNYFKSFIYSLLGPFPWQFRYERQKIALFETIPWYFLIAISFCGFFKVIKAEGLRNFLKHYKFTLPLLLFGLFSLGALSLFIDNFGIIVRIRIPAFICFLSAMFIGLNSEIENYYKKIYEKIFSYWRSWIYRLKHR